jgi:hypothetical protein
MNGNGECLAVHAQIKVRAHETFVPQAIYHLAASYNWLNEKYRNIAANLTVASGTMRSLVILWKTRLNDGDQTWHRKQGGEPTMMSFGFDNFTKI